MPLNTAVIYHNKGDNVDECYTPYYGVEPLLEFIPMMKTNEPRKGNEVFHRRAASLLRNKNNKER